MLEKECSRYVEYEDDANCPPCNCPVCGGFLKWEWNKNREDFDPKCNKCGAELIALPDHDEETKEELPFGRICPISERKK